MNYEYKDITFINFLQQILIMNDSV